MGFLNKKAVEGLPLKYIIIALVAALVVGIVLQMTGTLQGGIQSTAEKLNESTTERVTCELDNEAPVIGKIETSCYDGDLNVTATITDECGVAEAWFYNNLTEGSNSLTIAGADDTSANWTFSGSEDNWNETVEISVYAKDKATAETMSKGKVVVEEC